MYLSHFGLKAKPFPISTDPSFLWLGEKHKEALGVLKYGVIDNRGFLLLTGDVGTGKTTLINALLQSLPEQVVPATLHDPGLSPVEFFNFISRAFKLGQRFDAKEPFVSAFTEFLHRENHRGRQVLLVVDEAQRISQDLLEEIRLLSNIETAYLKLLNIFFVGQDEFNDILLEDRNRAIRQRITINYHIEPLDRDEVESYIRFRLSTAGTEERLFSRNAVGEIYTFSGGYPRLINIICDHALLTAYSRDMKRVNAAIIRECADELSIRSYKPPPAETGAGKALKPPESGRDKTRNNRRYLVAAGIAFLLLMGFIVYSFVHEPSLQSGVTEEKSSTPAETDSKAEPEPPAAKPEAPAETPPVPEDKEQPIAALPSAEETNEPPKTAEDSVDEIPRKMILHFGHDSYELDAVSLKRLDQAASTAKRKPELQIRLSGYSDSTGELQYNIWVSEFRAHIVRAYLEGKGIPARRIQVKGLGPAYPIASNSTVEGRELNRRVEIDWHRPIKP